MQSHTIYLALGTNLGDRLFLVVNASRKDEDFAAADQIRKSLAAEGIEIMDGAAGSSGAARGSSSGSTSSSDTGEKSDQQLALEVQRAFERQKEAVAMLSNMLRSIHEGRMGIINNCR